MNISFFKIDTITLKTAGALTRTGEKVYGAASTIKGRVEYNSNNV